MQWFMPVPARGNDERAQASCLHHKPFSKQWFMPVPARGNDERVQAGCLHHKLFSKQLVRLVLLGITCFVGVAHAFSSVDTIVRCCPGDPHADVMGNVLVALDSAALSPPQARANPPSLPGWPLAISNYPPDEGLLLVQADADPQLEVLFMTFRTVHLLNYDGTYLSGWPLTIPKPTADPCEKTVAEFCQ